MIVPAGPRTKGAETLDNPLHVPRRFHEPSAQVLHGLGDIPWTRLYTVVAI